MDVAYQVIWREPGGLERPARLRLEAHGVRLEPHEGEPHEVLFAEIVGVEIDAVPERGPALALQLTGGGEIELASNVKRWILSDLLAALFAHRLGPEGERRRVLVRARLKPGRGDEARRLIGEGPPFDPETTALVLHEAFVLDDDALFLFETHGDGALVELARPDFWHAAGAWSDLLAGSIRLVEPLYAWERGASSREKSAEVHPGLGL